MQQRRPPAGRQRARPTSTQRRPGQSRRGRGALRSAFRSNARNNGIFIEENKSLDKVFAAARKTGALRLSNKALREVPKEVFALNEQQNLSSEEKWWECVELTSIDVSNNSLTEISDAIGNLGDLKKVILSYNEIQRLPAGLGKLELLRVLKANHNKLSELDGQIFPRSSNIVELWLQHNSLTAVPDSICVLEHLKSLDLSNNKLESLPERLDFCRFLSSLDLANNAIRTLPKSLSNLQNLANLELACNLLSTIPDLSRTKLTQLDAHQNLLDTFPSLPQSTMQLHLNNNRLRGIEDAVKLENLAVLNVADNSLSKLTPGLQKLQGLKYLDVSNNNLSKIPGELGLIDSLNVLKINGNALRAFKKSLMGADINTLKKYLRTRIIGDVDEKYVQDRKANNRRHLLLDAGASGTVSIRKRNLRKIPDDVLQIPDLHTLDASENQLVGLPDGQMQDTLRVVRMEQNSFTEFPMALARLNGLEELSLRKNMLVAFPIKHAMRCLKHIDLRNNRLTTFPTGLLSMKNLQYCFLGFNEITRIPNLTFMTSLDTLDVSNNRLVTIDDGLRFLPRLQNLNIENNSLRAIPLEIGVCSGLKTLQVSGNPFRMLKHRIIQRGTAAIVEFVKNKIPLDSNLLHEGQRGSGNGAGRTEGKNVTDTEGKIVSMKQEIADLTVQLNSVRISNAQKYALKKKIALKRANLIRLERKMREDAAAS